MSKWVDKSLDDMDLTRKDLRYHMTWKGIHYYVATFKPLWWLITIVAVAGAYILMYACIVMVILIGPQP